MKLLSWKKTNSRYKLEACNCYADLFVGTPGHYMCTRGSWDNAHIILLSRAYIYISVMVRWVASSGHVADDHGSSQKVEVLQNFLLPQLHVSVCFTDVFSVL